MARSGLTTDFLTRTREHVAFREALQDCNLAQYERTVLFGTVSYTHLDVYKRQVEERVDVLALFGELGDLGLQLVGALAHAADSVSYTHLGPRVWT